MEKSGVSLNFPLRGEWTSAHTPAERVPSHGTDILGQAYAFDFLRIDWEKKGFVFHRKSSLQYFTIGVNVKDCYGYGEPIFSPANGTIVAAEDGLSDHPRLQPFADLLAVLGRSISFNMTKKPNIHKLTGNYITMKIKGSEAYAVFAHLKKDTIRVKIGEEVAVGQHLADLGHTGNSTAPHLHFQIMDRQDPFTAKGLPCVFEKYEAFKDGVWVVKTEGIPGLRERMRA
jgi:hypothetical protein